MTLRECLLCRVLCEEEDLNIVSSKDVQRMQKITGKDIQMTGDDDELVVCVSCRIHIDSTKGEGVSRSHPMINCGADVSSDSAVTDITPQNLPDRRMCTESPLYKQTLQNIIDEVQAVLGAEVPSKDCELWISMKKHSLVKQLSNQNTSDSDLRRVANLLALEWKSTLPKTCLPEKPSTSSSVIDLTTHDSNSHQSLLKYRPKNRALTGVTIDIQPITVQNAQELKKYPYLQPRQIANKPDRREDNHIKRPLNAFMIWSKEFRTVFKEKNPSLNNTQISKLLGESWQKMTAEQKDVYYLKSSRLMRQHSLEHPGYKYQPRIKKPRVYNLGPDYTLKSYSTQNRFSPYVSKYQKLQDFDSDIQNQTATSNMVADTVAQPNTLVDSDLQVSSVATINQEDFDKMDSGSLLQCSNDESDDSDVYIEENIDSDESDDIIDITEEEVSESLTEQTPVQIKHAIRPSLSPTPIILENNYAEAQQTPLHYIPVSAFKMNASAHSSTSHHDDLNHNHVRNGNIDEKGERIKRPLNAYMVFNKELRNGEFKGSTLHTSEVSAILSKRWKEMSDQMKSTYYEKAAKLSKEHMQKYPNYTYTPRPAIRGSSKWKKLPQFKDLYKL